MRTSTSPTILIVKHRALGDAVLSLSTISYIRSIFSNAYIIYGTPVWVAPLFKNIRCDADEILPMDFKNFDDWGKNLLRLRSKAPDFILELHQNGRTGKFFKLFSYLTKTPYFFHNHHTNKGLVVDQGQRKPAIQRDLDGAFSAMEKLFSSVPYPSFLDFPPRLEVSDNPLSNQKNFVLGVVATRETKMWPLEFYARLTFLLESKYPGEKILIPIGPGAYDRSLKEKLISMGVSSSTEFVHEPLDRLPLKLAGARGYIGNDTGLKHICAALGTKTLTFFGPEEPLEWHPYNEHEHPYLFRENLECRTKVAHFCPLNKCDSMICLNHFKPEEVVQNYDWP